MRVLLADNHCVILYALRALLENLRDYEVCGEARLGRSAIELSREKQPGVVVLNYTLPDLDGIHVAQQITKVAPDCKIVFFSEHDDIDIVRRAFQAGARSYIRKSEPLEHLVNALDAVRANEPYLTPFASEILLADVGKQLHLQPLLTHRESEVIELIARGVRRSKIAKQLSLSTKTIDTHRNAAMKKLGLRNVADIVRHALRNNLWDGKR